MVGYDVVEGGVDGCGVGLGDGKAEGCKLGWTDGACVMDGLSLG